MASAVFLYDVYDGCPTSTLKSRIFHTRKCGSTHQLCYRKGPQSQEVPAVESVACFVENISRLNLGSLWDTYYQKQE